MIFPGRTSNVINQGQAGQFGLPYRSGDDTALSLPLAPRSVEITTAYEDGVVDVRWDNPGDYPQNKSLFRVLGVNVYRALNSPFSDWVRINPVPLGTDAIRDMSSTQTVTLDATANLVPGSNPMQEWVIFTDHKPILDPITKKAAVDISAVSVRVDADGSGTWVPVKAFKVRGESGEIVLNTNRIYDPTSSTFSNAVLPEVFNGGRVEITYTYQANNISTSLSKGVYYKVTTVAQHATDGTMHETPLGEVEAKSLLEMENTDFIWREGIRRNRWILQQGGEWVKYYTRRLHGIDCPHMDPTLHQCGFRKAHSGYSYCPICYGTGIIGGYVGPIDLLIAPPDAEKSLTILDAGMHISYEFQSWTGPYPKLLDRDFIVRGNNERFFISRPNPVGSRGAIYQQSFTLTQADTTDPIYRVEVDGMLGTIEGWNAYREGRATPASPVMADKPGVPPQSKLIARTATFENIMF